MTSRMAKNVVYAKMGLPKLMSVGMDAVNLAGKLGKAVVTRPFTNSDVKSVIKSKGM